MFEWHEDAYSRRLEEYVYTPQVRVIDSTALKTCLNTTTRFFLHSVLLTSTIDEPIGGGVGRDMEYSRLLRVSTMNLDTHRTRATESGSDLSSDHALFPVRAISSFPLPCAATT